MKRFFLFTLLLCSSAFAQMSGSGSAVFGPGGLNVWQENTPVISGLTVVNLNATSVVLSWATDISSTTSAWCGSQQAPDNLVNPANTAHLIPVPGLVPSTSYTCHAQSGTTTQTIPVTTPPLPPTTPATGVSFGTWSEYDAVGPPTNLSTGDEYYNCKSDDGNTYFGTDDTVGWSGGGVSAAMMLAKFTSFSPITGANVNTLSAYGPCCSTGQPDGLSPKQLGIFCMGGDIFVTLQRQNESKPGGHSTHIDASIIFSQDHGVHWNNMQAPNVFTTTGTEMSPVSIGLWKEELPTNFGSGSFVMYDIDADGSLGYSAANNQADNANSYVYYISNGYASGSGISGWNNGDSFYLARVSRGKLAHLNPNDWQFYVSGDGTLDSSWSNVQANALPILTNTGELSVSNIQYLPALNCYILLDFYYPDGITTHSDSTFLIYTAPHPWGPYTLINTTNFPTTGFYSPIVLQTDALAATLGSTTMTVFATGDFGGSQYDMHYTTLTLSH